MGGPEEVDVGLLHQLDVTFVGGIVHEPSGAWMVVVAVHTAQLHVLSVDFKHLANHFHFFYSQCVLKIFKLMTFLVEKFYEIRISMWFFCRPEQWPVNIARQLYMYGVARSQLFHIVGEFP